MTMWSPRILLPLNLPLKLPPNLALTSVVCVCVCVCITNCDDQLTRIFTQPKTLCAVLSQIVCAQNGWGRFQVRGV